MAKLPKAPPVVSDINVTPMLNKGVNVDLVKTHNPIKMAEADREDAILIAVTRDGKVYLSPGNVKILPNDLAGKVKDLQQNRQDKTVYIKADARARFASVTDVIDQLRTDGVDQVGLLTEEVQDKNRRSAAL